MAGHCVRSHNIDISGFEFGDMVLDRQNAKFNVSPTFLRLRSLSFLSHG